MINRLVVLLSLFMLTLPALAGKCVCRDNFGNGKKACFNSVVQCKSFCGIMSMSFGEGSCDGGTPIPSLPIGQVMVYALTETLWTDSNIDVKAGEILTIKAIAENAWQTNKYWIAGGANGHPNYQGGPNYLLPSGPEGALVGRVGNGPVFLIGGQGNTPQGASGRLYIGPNDEPSGRFDNVGSITVQVGVVAESVKTE